MARGKCIVIKVFNSQLFKQGAFYTCFVLNVNKAVCLYQRGLYSYGAVLRHHVLGLISTSF